MAPRLQKQKSFFTPHGGSSSQFAVDANRKYPHLQKSVAVIGVRKNGKEMCLLHPRKAAEDMRIPPQGRIQNPQGDMRREAQRIVNEKAGLMINLDQFYYLGYAFTDRHHANGDVTNNGKLVHWLCAGFGDDPKLEQTYSKNEYADIVEWWHVKGVLGQMADLDMMSARKLYMLESAIIEMPDYHPGFKAKVFQDHAISVDA